MGEMTRTLKALFLLLRDMDIAEEDCTSELDERVDAIKGELGSWFIDDYQLYVGS